MLQGVGSTRPPKARGYQTSWSVGGARELAGRPEVECGIWAPGGGASRLARPKAAEGTETGVGVQGGKIAA